MMVLTVASSILSVPTSLPFRSLGWFSSTSSEPCSSMSMISSCEIFTNPGGSLRLDEEGDEMVMGIRGIGYVG
jgi:hypothetical protein